MTTKTDETNTETAPGNGVEVVGSTPASVAGLAALPAEVKQFLASAQEAVGMDDETAELAMLAQVLQATTPDTILGLAEVLHAKDFVNKEVTIHGYRWQRSDFEQGVGVYMVWDVTTEPDGALKVMTCGSKMCMAQVYALAQHDFLPVEVTVTQAEKPTKAGFYPLRLVTPEVPF